MTTQIVAARSITGSSLVFDLIQDLSSKLVFPDSEVTSFQFISFIDSFALYSSSFNTHWSYNKESIAYDTIFILVNIEHFIS